MKKIKSAISLFLILTIMFGSLGCNNWLDHPDESADSKTESTVNGREDIKYDAVSTDKLKIGAYLWYAFSSVTGVKDFAEQGFYDFRQPIWGYGYCEQEDMDYQIQLAYSYGIDYFAIDYYNSVMDYPSTYAIDYFIASEYSSLMEFCLMIVQDTQKEIPSAEEWDASCDKWLRYIKTENYLKIDGCPVLIFSNPFLMVEKHGSKEKTKELLDSFRDKIKEAGYSDVIYCGTIWDTFDWFLEETYDSSTKPSANLAGEIDILKYIGIDTITHYNNISHAYYEDGVKKSEMPFAEMTRRHELCWNVYSNIEGVKYIPCLTSGWDNRPREAANGGETAYATDRSSETFRDHVVNSYKWLEKNYSKSVGDMIIINAWDEIEEGGYLVPTVGEGYKMLDGLRDAINEINAMK